LKNSQEGIYDETNKKLEVRNLGRDGNESIKKIIKYITTKGHKQSNNKRNDREDLEISPFPRFDEPIKKKSSYESIKNIHNNEWDSGTFTKRVPTQTCHDGKETEK